MCLVLDDWQGRRTATRSKKNWGSMPLVCIFLEFACGEGALSDSNGWMCKPGSPQYIENASRNPGL